MYTKGHIRNSKSYWLIRSCIDYIMEKIKNIYGKVGRRTFLIAPVLSYLTWKTWVIEEKEQNSVGTLIHFF